MTLLARRVISPAGAVNVRPPPVGISFLRRANRSARKATLSNATKDSTLTGVVFEPSQVKNELATVSKTNAKSESFARVNFHEECEAAINEQINIEYNVSYLYHALHVYFDRDNVGLPGFAKFFKAASDEERDHAQLLMEYQNKRGGRVSLKSIVMPDMEFDHADKGDALYGMELALSLEKLNFQKLRELHEVADKHGDANMADFIEGDLLADQIDSVKSAAEMVSQLRRIGKGLPVYIFDKHLMEGGGEGEGN